MVCKEDVLLWFKDLDSYKRIDVLYDLLNMCLPFELRFLGSCVEEIGKHTYQELRGPALLANDYEKLTKDATLNQSLLDDTIRHRVLIYLSLLSSKNYTVANWLYKNFLRTECVEEFLLKTSVKSDNLLSEFLLLYTMALHHPAFTFEQKLFFGNLLNRLVEYKEHKNRFSPKPSMYGYPPGFGFPTFKAANTTDSSSIPIKANMTMSYGDLKVPLASLHPMVPPQQPLDYTATIWNRPGVHCGAPEFQVPPFPPPPSISPLVSQAGTPTHSRSTSPHRTTTTVNVRMPLTARPPPAPLPNVDVMPPPVASVLPPLSQPVSIDPLPHSSLPPMFGANSADLKLPDDELNQLPDAQLAETPWIPPRGIVPDNLKPPNGLCYPPQYPHKMPVPYLIEQMQALNMEGENSLHHSNSSSNSSLNQSPPETPTVMPHGPGRGPEKPRMNGIPPPPPSTTFINNLPPMCDTTPPPPAFNNCTVPYTSYPATFNQMPPNRSIFQYTTQPYCRPHFSAPFPNYQNSENTIPPYTVPYVSILYSSPQFPPRHPTGCYNCGATGHIGQDCTAQNIEEITQKKAFSLDYNNAIRDAENK
ncbi:extensin-2 isoform X1 [Coccinella septempunctata]|uniref:extensin-2 isoform X1 n=1 Tax=Coccinella septempunctata TaxID=41139 RepID=UPI001D07CC4C|nr:extensin-2 isoform X1 [Coccinella septempunctata]